MGDRLVLNGFDVDPALAELMRRNDWQSARTDSTWITRFATHPSAGRQVPFVEFCGPEWAAFENEGLRSPELAILRGQASASYPPGDFDPDSGYLIGFTESADAGIFVDLRGASGARIIYDCLATELVYATAFASIPEFVEFYLERHGR